jgi:hypothetical protein
LTWTAYKTAAVQEKSAQNEHVARLGAASAPATTNANTFSKAATAPAVGKAPIRGKQRTRNSTRGDMHSRESWTASGANSPCLSGNNRHRNLEAVPIRAEGMATHDPGTRPESIASRIRYPEGADESYQSAPGSLGWPGVTNPGAAQRLACPVSASGAESMPCGWTSMSTTHGTSTSVDTVSPNPAHTKQTETQNKRPRWDHLHRAWRATRAYFWGAWAAKLLKFAWRGRCRAHDIANVHKRVKVGEYPEVPCFNYENPVLSWINRLFRHAAHAVSGTSSASWLKSVQAHQARFESLCSSCLPVLAHGWARWADVECSTAHGQLSLD